MLVLTRKLEQSIAVGVNGGLLKITILGVSNGNVRLGFEVDAAVPVHRWEVWEKICGEAAGAAAAAAVAVAGTVLKIQDHTSASEPGHAGKEQWSC